MLIWLFLTTHSIHTLKSQRVSVREQHESRWHRLQVVDKYVNKCGNFQTTNLLSSYVCVNICKKRREKKSEEEERSMIYSICFACPFRIWICIHLNYNMLAANVDRFRQDTHTHARIRQNQCIICVKERARMICQVWVLFLPRLIIQRITLDTINRWERERGERKKYDHFHVILEASISYIILLMCLEHVIWNHNTSFVFPFVWLMYCARKIHFKIRRTVKKSGKQMLKKTEYTHTQHKLLMDIENTSGIMRETHVILLHRSIPRINIYSVRWGKEKKIIVRFLRAYSVWIFRISRFVYTATAAAITTSATVEKPVIWAIVLELSLFF